MKKVLLFLAAFLVSIAAMAKPTANEIEVSNVTQNSFTFKINLSGYYKFYPLAKAELSQWGTASYYLELFGIPDIGPKSYEWVDGSYFNSTTSSDQWPMSVKPDRDYIVAVAATDAAGNITGETYTYEFRTPATEQSDASVQVTTSNITSTSVQIDATPDASVSNYYIYVRDKEWYEGIISGYGEGMLATLIKYPSAGAWNETGAISEVWGGLTPKTEHYIGVLAVDATGAESLELIPFTTLAASGAAPKIEITMTPHESRGHNTIMLTIKAENATQIYYAFNTNADVKDAREAGNSDAQIAKNNGNLLSDDEVSQACGPNGLKREITDLWRSTDYACVACAVNAEKTEAGAGAITTTNPEPVPTRVESDLFETLVDEWVISYKFIDFQGNEVSIDGAIVQIVQGVDEASEEEYRSLNRLVVLDYPFQHDWETNPIPSYLPGELMAAANYWNDDPSLAYRDYGPKFFLEIAADGSITIPTALNYNFFNWSDNEMRFYGADYDKGQSAPATFPVTLSGGGNTLTIGAHYSNHEFGFGTYRPAIFMHINGQGDQMWNVATTDIVLTRVGTDGVESVKKDVKVGVIGNSIIAPANAEVYSLSGYRVGTNNLPAGIYIVRYDNQATKVVIK